MLTRAHVINLVGELNMSLIDQWLERGDGVAVYRNMDLGHPDVGHVQAVSFGSPDAQLETDEPPKILPDIGGAINWRYHLVGTYRGVPPHIRKES